MQKRNRVSTLFNVSLFLVFLIFIVLSSNYATFSHDDPTNMAIFQQILKQEGLPKSLWLLFTNFDFRSIDYRPFWFSRTLHFFLFQIFKNNPLYYAIVMNTLHFLSGYLVFSIIKRISNSKELGYLSSIIWIFTPFSTPLFVFHHFCYQVIPVYFFLLYAYLTLYKIALKQYLFLLLIFFMVFSGEQGLILLIPFLIIRIASFYRQHDLSRIKECLVQGVFAITAVLLHIKFLSWLVLSENAQHVHRFRYFSLYSFNEVKEIFFPWIKEQVIPTYYQILFIFSSDYANATNIHWNTIIPILLFLLLLLLIIYKHLNYLVLIDSKRIIITAAFLALYCCISFSVYAYITVMSGGGGYFPRYAFFTGSTSLIMVIVFFFGIFKIRFARMLSWILICYLLLLYLISNLELKPIIYSLSQQIDLAFQTGIVQGKKAVLIAHSLRYPPKAQVNYWWAISVFDSKGAVNGLINMYFTGVQNQYKYFYSLDRIAINFFGYNTVSYHNFTERNGIVELTDTNGNKSEYSPEDILIIGNPNIDYSYSDKSKQSITTYSSWEDFKNSPAYKGVIVFSSNKIYANSQSNLFETPDSIVDLGNADTDKKISNSTSQKSLAIGFKEGEDIINPPDAFVHPSEYWISNRAGQFTYYLGEVSDGGSWIVFDFLELWQSENNKRVFSIIINNDNSSQTIGPIDLTALGGYQQQLSIAIWINETSHLSIETKKDPSSLDIPFISGIRLYHNLKI